MRSSSLFSLLALLPAVLLASTDPSLEVLEFDPPLLTLNDDRTAPARLRVRLRQLPHAPTSLYFESPNLRFSQCQMHFSPRTYNEWQDVDVRGLPYFVDADNAVKEVVTMRMACPQGRDGWHGRNWTMPVNRPNARGATCSSNGDPHVTTFDGKYYSYQGLGCFYMLKSDALVVQTLTDTWSGGATVSVATAVRWGKAHFIVDSREQDPGKRLTQLSETAPGVDVTMSESREEFRFKFADGSDMVITFHGASPRNYLDHQISVPNHYRQKTNGWCGTFNTNQADDWTAADGQVKTDMNACADTWKVPVTDDIFTCKDACPDAAKVLAAQMVKPCDMCRIPTNLDGAGKYRDSDPAYTTWKGSQGGYHREKPSYAGQPLHLTPRVTTDAGFRSRAKAACEAAFNVPDLHKIVSTTPYLNSCVTDCELTGTLEMVDAKKSAYLTHVYTNMNPVLATTAYTGQAPNKALEPVVATCQKAAAQLGLGQRRCPNDCSGHGVCRKSGCKCKAGWTGVACAVRLDAYGIPVVHGGRAAQQSVYGPPQSSRFRNNDEEDGDDMDPRAQFGGPRRPVLADDSNFTPRPMFPNTRPLLVSNAGRGNSRNTMNGPTTVLEDDGDMEAHGGPGGDNDPFMTQEEEA